MAARPSKAASIISIAGYGFRYTQVHDRFTEGFETADLKTAKALLDSLQ
jgi:hypothetical protein